MSTPIDPTTTELVQWAKRAATADLRERLAATDLLCGLHLMRLHDAVAPVLEQLLRRPAHRVVFGEAVYDAAARAQEADPVDEPMPFEKPVEDAVAGAHAIDPSLPPGHLVAALFAQPDPAIVRFLDANREDGAPSRLIEQLAGALDASERLAARLQERVLGQHTAVRMLCDAYFRARIGQPARGPRGVFTFLGPPGVGKTLLAESFASELGEVEGEPIAWKRFDMSTMAGEQNFEGLFGTETIYRNSRPGTLTGFVAEHPRCVLLFDEIEKAHDQVIQSLLAILDRGEVVDKSLDRPVDFSQAWILVTTNLGREFFSEANQSGVMQGLDLAPGAVFDLLASARRFRDGGDDGTGEDASAPALAPEFVSRLAKGGAVVFRHLEVRHFLQLVDLGLEHALEGARETSGVALPAVAPTPGARLAFLASLLPDLDARRAVSRSEAWALDLVKRAFEACRPDLTAANPSAWSIAVAEGPQLADWLAAARQAEPTRVLLVDDDDVLTAPLQAAAGSEPVTIEHVTSGDAVAAAARRLQPSLALLDLSIHEPDDSPRVARGLACLAQLRREFPALPVVLFSEAPERRDGFAATLAQVMERGGARAFVPVPTEGASGDLAADLRALLDEVRHEAMLRRLRRGHKTLTFEPAFTWDAAATEVHCALGRPRESVVYEATDQTSPIRFRGVPRETLGDVVGLRRAKRRLGQVIGWLRDPAGLRTFGVMPPRGFLLAGPPGTGKTLLARAVAGEAGLPFLSLSAGELKSKWVGESEARIRELFRKAREYAPAIVFIDEIDGIARRRSPDEMAHTYSTLNQLLACMDGFAGRDRSIFVLAATNHAEELDPAILRPGRFDEVIPVDLPDATARAALFDLRLEAAGVAGADTADLAAGTVGCSPAEIDRIVREAIYAASAAGRAEVTADDLDAARRLVRFGAAREDLAIAADERAATAWHEAGHAIAHTCLRHGGRVDHLTIVPTESGALGFMAPLADESRHDLTREDVRARIAVALAGREAERRCPDGPGDLGAGASSDLAHATRLAWRAVTDWGFDDEFGPVALSALPPSQAVAFADHARARVDAWLADAAALARQTLDDHADRLATLAGALLEREFLDGDELREVLGESTGGPAR
jgi:ATP-dependent metalloprotease FtsH